MKYLADDKKRKAFNRTSHKKRQNWPAMAKKHRRLFALATIAPCLGAAMLVVLARGTSIVGEDVIYSNILWAIAGGGIPFIIFWPMAIISYKNDKYGFGGKRAWKYDDTLAFTEKSIVYAFKNAKRGPHYYKLHEITVPYKLIDRIVYDKWREQLIITAGGVDTHKECDGQIIERMNYRTGYGYVNPFSRVVTIDMVYPDNNAVLKSVEDCCSPVPIEYVNDNGGE